MHKIGRRSLCSSLYTFVFTFIRSMAVFWLGKDCASCSTLDAFYLHRVATVNMFRVRKCVMISSILSYNTICRKKATVNMTQSIEPVVVVVVSVGRAHHHNVDIWSAVLRRRPSRCTSCSRMDANGGLTAMYVLCRLLFLSNISREYAQLYGCEWQSIKIYEFLRWTSVWIVPVPSTHKMSL